MKDHADGDERPPIAPGPHPANCYNLISMAAPFLGVLGFMAAGGLNLFDHWPDLSTSESWRATIAVATLALSCLGGFVSACVAIARGERLVGLSVLGLLFNAPLPLLFLGSGLQFLANWWNFG